MDMTPAQLEQQSRDAVCAYLQDSSVRLETIRKYMMEKFTWSERPYEYLLFNLADFYYRIAQPKPWFRVGLYKSGIVIAETEAEESDYVDCSYFIKWLTDRVEYDC